MIDIDAMERRMTRRDDEPLLPPSPEEVLALIAEIRRLRGKRKEHRKCPCGGGGQEYTSPGGRWWIECDLCECSTDFMHTPEEAWAAWDGVA